MNLHDTVRINNPRSFQSPESSVKTVFARHMSLLSELFSASHVLTFPQRLYGVSTVMQRLWRPPWQARPFEGPPYTHTWIYT